MTAKSLAQAAETGDSLAIEIYEESGKMLGLGLSVIVDIINPQANNNWRRILKDARIAVAARRKSPPPRGARSFA